MSTETATVGVLTVAIKANVPLPKEILESALEQLLVRAGIDQPFIINDPRLLSKGHMRLEFGYVIETE